MLRLDLTAEPRWLDLGHGVRLRAAPLTTAMMVASRSDGRIDGADPSIAALTGRVEVRFADSTLVSQAIAGDPCELEFAYALPSGESFTFTVHAVYLPRPRIEIAGPQGVQATFDWQAARDTGVGRMCTATLINDIEEY